MTDRIFEAIEFAVKAHRGQFRKGTKIPFIVHPMDVGRKLIEIGAQEDLVIAGILHDTVEDTSVTLDEIKVSFGKKVADIIYTVSEPDKAKSWRERKQHTINKLETASMDVLIVECADKLDNILAIQSDYKKESEAFWSRFNCSKEQQKWYYMSLDDVFSKRKDNEVIIKLVEHFHKAVDKVFGPADKAVV